MRILCPVEIDNRKVFVAEWVENLTADQRVMGSIPANKSGYCSELQLEEHFRCKFSNILSVSATKQYDTIQYNISKRFQAVKSPDRW